MASSPTAAVASDTDFTHVPSALSLNRICLRLRVRLAAPRLDTNLASDSPLISESSMLRAAQLVSPRERTRLAVAIERVCAERAPRQGYSAAVPVSAEAIEVARPALRQLAAALRAPGVHRARGVALTRLLLTEPDSPLYRPAHPDALYEAARTALLALVCSQDAVPHLIGGR